MNGSSDKTDDDDDDNDYDDDDDSNNQSKYYTHTIEAMKTKTGLDIGYKVIWPKRKFCIPKQNDDSCGTSTNDHGRMIAVPHNNRLSPNDTTPCPSDDDAYDVVAVPQPSTDSVPHLHNAQEAKCDDTTDNTYNDECVVLELSTQLPSDCIAPMFHGTQWAGTTIWRSAVVALQYLLYYQNGESVVTGSKISGTSGNEIQLDPSMTLLELGCGLGVPGMVLHSVTGCRTILTDKDDLLVQLQRNIQVNFYNTEKDPIHENKLQPDQHSSTGGRIEAQALDWSIEGVHELLERSTNISSINVILACDCIYEPLYGDSWRNLLTVQNELLRIYPQAYVLTACHRRPSDGIDTYIIDANEKPYISRIEQLHIPFAHSSVVELYRLHGNE